MGLATRLDDRIYIDRGIKDDYLQKKTTTKHPRQTLFYKGYIHHDFQVPWVIRLMTTDV
jgi:hypothetical protein